jgi:hypothetical protein
VRKGREGLAHWRGDAEMLNSLSADTIRGVEHEKGLL